MIDKEISKILLSELVWYVSYAFNVSPEYDLDPLVIIDERYLKIDQQNRIKKLVEENYAK